MKRIIAVALALVTVGVSAASAGNDLRAPRSSSTARVAVVTCGSAITSPGVYELTADLNCSGAFVANPNVPPGAALYVNSSGVTINLNGHSIFGPGATTSSTGVWIEGDALIENGTIRGFGTGVLGTASGVQTNDLRVAKNGYGIFGSLMTLTVSNSYINENTADGIYASVGLGIGVSNSQVNGNGGNGITDHETGFVGVGNIISRNGGYGIWNDEYGVSLKNNQVNNNGSDGIYLGLNPFPDTYWLLNNTANGNGGHGIDFAARSQLIQGPSYFEGNIARDNLTNPQCINILCRTS